MNSELEQRVRSRLDNLTKPRGSLGRLEDLVIQLALIQQTEHPTTSRKGLYIFCGNHGVTAEGVSPFPSSVTHAMMRNFAAGGAAINVLCRRENIVTEVVDAGTEPGTKNFAQEPAMTRAEATNAIALGSRHAEDAAERFDIAGLGEMGIGNTTSAAAIFSALTGIDVGESAGSGTGLDEEGVLRKARVIRGALDRHRPDRNDGVAVLAAVGGFEIAAIAGFIGRASEIGLPVVLDGFPCCAGALVAQTIRPGALGTSFFGHRSAEKGHEKMLQTLGAKPVLDLGMRLGEGTGAALAMGIIDRAITLYREMATFGEAQVSMER
ncbi:MAG: nicotinate-nucleotide--dimethylbenzimidazole phosphoribosyltransferase [Bryobacteraceae bacterium]|nr:nicotinate-nucleotide--dimethylbenzimidazole phosphoribosyltransferase [Bryobacteraceae bacterium]